MRLLSCTEFQKRELGMLHPFHRVADYFAFIPSGEWNYWARKFTLLHDDLCGRFPAVRNAAKAMSSFPIVQCVTKLGSVNNDGYLIPRVFKFTTLPEGMRDFGVSTQAAAMLEALAASLPVAIKSFPSRYHRVNKGK